MNNKGQTLIEYLLAVIVLLTAGAVAGPKLITAVRHRLGYITVDECVDTVMRDDFKRLPATLR